MPWSLSQSHFLTTPCEESRFSNRWQYSTVVWPKPKVGTGDTAAWCCSPENIKHFITLKNKHFHHFLAASLVGSASVLQFAGYSGCTGTRTRTHMHIMNNMKARQLIVTGKQVLLCLRLEAVIAALLYLDSRRKKYATGKMIFTTLPEHVRAESPHFHFNFNA